MTSAILLRVLVLASVGLVFANGVVLRAQSDVINACAQKQNGQIRIVDASSQCRPAEVPLTWNATGPSGTGPAFSILRVPAGGEDRTLSEDLFTPPVLLTLNLGSGIVRNYIGRDIFRGAGG